MKVLHPIPLIIATMKEPLYPSTKPPFALYSSHSLVNWLWGSSSSFTHPSIWYLLGVKDTMKNKVESLLFRIPRKTYLQMHNY